VRAVIAALGGASGAILTSRIFDTVKRVDGDDTVVDTIPRERLRFALTPQVFRVSTLMGVWERSDMARTWTDEAALLEAAGLQVRAVLARQPNPKVTTGADLQIVRAMVEQAP
jgi:2-C-methyl-D-erythritol 4-phosphate cytidylyltransferase